MTERGTPLERRHKRRPLKLRRPAPLASADGPHKRTSPELRVWTHLLLKREPTPWMSGPLAGFKRKRAPGVSFLVAPVFSG